MAKQAARIAKGRDRPQIVEVLVWPHLGEGESRPELRSYYALNLPQAAARAVEAEVRLREQDMRAALAAIRSAREEETERFFSGLESLPLLVRPVCINRRRGGVKKRGAKRKTERSALRITNSRL